MFFETIRERAKWIVYIFVAALGVTLLYTGGQWASNNASVEASPVASVNGNQVTDFQLETVRFELMRRDEVETELTAEHYRYLALENIVHNWLHLDAAKALGLKVSDAEIDQYLRDIEAFYGVTWQTFLRDYLGMDASQGREYLREQLLLTKLQEQKYNEAIASITDEDVEEVLRNEVLSRPDEFEEVEVSHIWIYPTAFTDEEAIEASRLLAEQLAAEIEAGADMGPLALEHSQDPNVELNEGYLGFIRRGTSSWEPEFEEAVFSLESGAVSVVETGVGFHVVQIGQRRNLDEDEAYIETVRQGIRNSLEAEVAFEAWVEWTQELWEQANVEILDPRLKAQRAFTLEEFERSTELFLEAIAAEPENPNLEVYVARAYDLIGEHEKALEHFEKAIEKRPNAEFHLIVGIHLSQSEPIENKERAFEILQRAAELGSQIQNEYGLEITLAATQALNELAEELGELPEPPEMHVAAYAWSGLDFGNPAVLEPFTALRSGELEAAAEGFQAAIAEMPDEALLEVFLAQAYQLDEDHETALQHFDKALEKGSDSSHILLLAGWGYFQAGEIEKAEEIIREGVAVAMSDEGYSLENQVRGQVILRLLSEGITRHDIDEVYGGLPVYGDPLNSYFLDSLEREIFGVVEGHGVVDEDDHESADAE